VGNILEANRDRVSLALLDELRALFRRDLVVDDDFGVLEEFAVALDDVVLDRAGDTWVGGRRGGLRYLRIG
jgi:hypothetical protein